MSRTLKGGLFQAALLFSLAVGFVTLGALLVDVFRRGVQWTDRVLITNPPSIDPQIAGARPAILATLYLGGLLLLFAVPIGVGAALGEVILARLHLTAPGYLVRLMRDPMWVHRRNRKMWAERQHEAEA